MATVLRVAFLAALGLAAIAEARQTCTYRGDTHDCYSDEECCSYGRCESGYYCCNDATDCCRNSGVYYGSVGGLIIVCGIIGCIVYFCCIRPRQQQQQQQQQAGAVLIINVDSEGRVLPGQMQPLPGQQVQYVTDATQQGQAQSQVIHVQQAPRQQAQGQQYPVPQQIQLQRPPAPAPQQAALGYAEAQPAVYGDASPTQGYGQPTAQQKQRQQEQQPTIGTPVKTA